MPEEPDRGLPHRDPRPLGVAVFLASLSALILSAIIGHLAVRFRADQWPPPGAPEIPRIVWFGTALLLISSLAIQRGLASIRRGDARVLQHALLATCVLAVGFLACQAAAAAAMAKGDGEGLKLSMTFLLLVILHAVHVLGGLGPLAVTARRALAGRYSRDRHEGVRLLTIYWHFLDVAWLAMLAALVI